MSKQQERNYVEMGTEPELYATDLRVEDAGGGNVRIFWYSPYNHQSEYRLQFTQIVPSALLPHLSQCLMAAPHKNAMMASADFETIN